MPDSISLDVLARQWREFPGQGAFAALAEGLRKRGDYAEAIRVVEAGLSQRPGDLPALVVLSRIRRDRGDHEGAKRALREALAADQANPVVRRALQQFEEDSAPVGESSDDLLYTDDGPAVLEGEPLLTESLAILYHRQGHLERAAEVYRALVERDPGNIELRARCDPIMAEAAGRRPRPYDAAMSGGRPLREWLAALAAITPAAAGPGTAYDAFYQTPSEGSAHTDDSLADFEAFQSWLKGLGR